MTTKSQAEIGTEAGHWKKGTAMSKSEIEARLRTMTDEELDELAGSELTKEGKKALGIELTRRQSPEYAAEEQRRAAERVQHEEGLAHQRERNREARWYAWVCLFLTLPLMVYVDWRFQSAPEPPLTAAGKRNLRIQEESRSDLSEEDREFLAKIDEGKELSKRSVDRFVTYGGVGVALWFLFFLASRGALGVRDSRRKRKSAGLG